MSDDRHNGKTSRGGVPAAQTADELLHHDDGTLGALLVGSLCSADVRHSNFAALGRLVRAGVAALDEEAFGLERGLGALGEVVRRPGKHRPRPKDCQRPNEANGKPAASGQPDDAAGRSTEEGRDRPRAFRHSSSGPAREGDAPYGSDVTGAFSLSDEQRRCAEWDAVGI
jgi:hypothetical protein